MRRLASCKPFSQATATAGSAKEADKEPQGEHPSDEDGPPPSNVVRVPIPAPDDPEGKRERGQRKVVDAFLAASRSGDFEGLIAVLDPEVVFRTDAGEAAEPRPPVVGAAGVARIVLARGSRFAPFCRPAVVNGTAGLVFAPGATPTVVRGRITTIDLILDPEKLPSN